AEARDEYALVQQALGEGDRVGGLSDDDRDDRRLTLERSVARVGEHRAERPRVLAQSCQKLRLLEHELDRPERTAGDGGRERIREELRSRALLEQVANLLRRGHVS